jgi:hypothetical protein
MQLRLHAFTCFTVFVSLQCAAADAASKIKKMDPVKRESLRIALQNDLAKGGDALSSWFSSVCICAPQLWTRISPTLDKKGIEIIPTHFSNPDVPASKDGAALKGFEANRRLARQVAPLLAAGKVRLPTEDEIRAYWRIFPFNEIEEPVFVVSSARADVLVHLQWDKGKQRYFVFLLEAFRLSKNK